MGKKGNSYKSKRMENNKYINERKSEKKKDYTCMNKEHEKNEIKNIDAEIRKVINVPGI